MNPGMIAAILAVLGILWIKASVVWDGLADYHGGNVAGAFWMVGAAHILVACGCVAMAFGWLA